MNRSHYLSLAASGVAVPIAVHLALCQHADADRIQLDANRLGEVIARTAERYGTPLAFPLMDLRLEKADLLAMCCVPEREVDEFHFPEAPDESVVERVAGALDSFPFRQRSLAQAGAIRFIAEKTSLSPIGMCIGPFSLMTKLIEDPITPVAMAGMGLTAEDDPSILAAERCLALAELTVRRSIAAQVRAGAKAILVCEPAANCIYLSPRQIEHGADIFERFVMQPNLRMKAQLDQVGVDLVFHNCGELVPFMVEQFGTRIHPAILSLGSSRELWEDAPLVPKDVVLFGNLPTKSFYSDEAMPARKVEQLTRETIERMRTVDHPHILGSECDVLYVPESAETILAKVDLMCRVAGDLRGARRDPVRQPE